MSDFPTFSLASTITPSDFLAPTIALRLSDYRLSTMKLTHRASQSREKSQKIARKIIENRPDFCPGCCAGAVAAVGLPSPAFLYPRRLALCGRLCGAFRGLPVPLYPCPVAWLCAPSVAAVEGLHPGGAVRLCLWYCGRLSRSCTLSSVPAWLCPGAAGMEYPGGVPCGDRPGGAAVGCGGAGQRKARASCTSSTRAQKNRRRDCTRGGSVVSFIHFQKL